MRRSWLSALMMLACGCAPTPVEVDVRFPREENFLFSEFAQLLVYEVDPETGLGDCPTILEQIEGTGIGDPILTTERVPVCQLRSGDVRFDDVPPGPHAFVVLAFDDADGLLLDGCRVAEAYVDAPPIEVSLFPTVEYTPATSTRTLTCGSAADKCAPGGGCR